MKNCIRLLVFSTMIVLLNPQASYPMGLFPSKTDPNPNPEIVLENVINKNVNPEVELNKFTLAPDVRDLKNCPVDPVVREQKKVPETTAQLYVTNKDQELFENFAKVEGDPIALKQALCFYRKYSDTSFGTKGEGKREINLQNRRYITINDLNKRSDVGRLYVIDMETKEIKVYFSAHGQGGHKGVGENDFNNAQYYSNIDDSYASPRGMFLTGPTYVGQYGYSMRLRGLQREINDNSILRDVVMHGFKDMNPAVASSSDENPKEALHAWGNVAMSKGCPMLEPERAREVINKIKSNDNGPSLYYNYTQEEKALGENYCADTNLMVK